jgi:hypothetical protein
MTAIITDLEEAGELAAQDLREAHEKKNTRRKAVLQRALELCDDRTLELEETEFHDADMEDTLEAEKERDAATKEASEQHLINAKLNEQLQQLQAAAAKAVATPPAPAAGGKAGGETQQQSPSQWSDYMLDFPAEEADVPKLAGPPTAEQAEMLARLYALLQAPSFGGALPALTFGLLGAPPWFIHRLVGDTIWHACWGDRHGVIDDDFMVPAKLLNIVRHVVMTMAAQIQQTEQDRQQAAASLRQADVAAQERRAQGAPY